MARHLAQETGKHTDAGKAGLSFGSAKLPDLRGLLRPWPRFKFKKAAYVRDFSRPVILPVLAAAVLFALSLFIPRGDWLRPMGFALSACAAAYTPIVRVFISLARRRFPAEELAGLAAAVLLFSLGRYAAAPLALLLWRLSELVEAYVLMGAGGALETLRAQVPVKAHLETVDGPRDTSPEGVEIGALVRVYPREVFPLDGVIVEGKTAADFSTLTGGSDMRSLTRGSQVSAGSVNKDGEVIVQVTRLFVDSALAELLDRAEYADDHRAELDQLCSRIAAWYLPGVVLLALLLAVAVPPMLKAESRNWFEWLSRAAVVLLLASPSALSLSLPLVYRGAIQRCASLGIVVKGEDCVEDFARTKTMVFTKTGIVTEGVYRIGEICPEQVDAAMLLAVAAAAESYSQHPIAIALKDAAGWTKKTAENVEQSEEKPGKGVAAFVEGRFVLVGNASLMEEHSILCSMPKRSGSAIHVAVNNVYWGYIMVADKPREHAFDALEGLRLQGVNNTVMLTGDVLSVSRPLASAMSFDMVKAELPPEGKRSAIEYLMDSMGSGERLAFVGDGIHDAALLEKADLGITLNALQREQAMSAADMAILGDDIMTLPALMRICQRAYRIAWINVGLVGGMKLLLLILAAGGVLSVTAAAIAELIVTGLSMFNALRIYGVE